MENILEIQEDHKRRLVEFCDNILEFFGWSLEAEEAKMKNGGSRSIKQTDSLMRLTVKAKSEAEINHGLGITTLYENIRPGRGYSVGWSEIQFISGVDDYTEENIQNQITYSKLIKSLIELHTDWTNKEAKALIGSINVGEDTTDFKIPEGLLKSVNDLVMKNHFNFYLYQDSGEKIGSNDVFHISSQIGFSSDITLWINHLKNQSDFLDTKDKNHVYVTLFGKIDELSPLYSNWVITLHKGETIWLVTDSIQFDNPYQKSVRLGRRSAWRERAETYDACDLPYEIFWELEEERKKQSSVVHSSKYRSKLYKHVTSTSNYNEEKARFKEGLASLMDIEYDVIIISESNSSWFSPEVATIKRNGVTVAVWYSDTNLLTFLDKPEFFFRQYGDLKIGQKVFFSMLISELITYLGSQNVEPPRIALAQEFTKQKMIEGAVVDLNGKSTMRYWTDESKEIFQELLETLEDGEEKTKALSVHNYNSIVKSDYYNASWLTTPEKMESLSEWMILEKQKEDIYSKMTKMVKNKEDYENWIVDEMNRKFKFVIDRVCHFKRVSSELKCYGSFSTDPVLNEVDFIYEITEEKRKELGVYASRGLGLGKSVFEKEPCLCCGSRSSKLVKRIRLSHYKQILWILGLDDRKSLPKYYRQYRRNNHYPYTGNCILDQTHPYLRIQDPMSRRHPNGFDVDVYLCGYCYRDKVREEKMTLSLEKLTTD